MKKILIAILFSILTGICFGQSLEKELDAVLIRRFPAQGPGAAVLVAKANRVLYKKAFGKANLELNVALKPGYIFRIGSITKQFTACAILKLAEEGKLSLQSEVTEFIRDYPIHGITIEHLLTHTSGINTGAGAWTPETRKKDFTPQALIDSFKLRPPDFLPGASFRYNNNGYVLLGYIVELVSGMPYEEYISRHFFRPLGMKNSGYDNSSLVIPGRVSGYQRDNELYTNADYLSMTQPYSAGSLFSTVEDLYTWNEALTAGKVINKESLRKAQTSFKLDNGKLTGYGYGWWLGNIQGSPCIKHDGLINGFSTFALYLPQEKIFVAVFTNCENNNPEVIGSEIAGIAIGKPYHTNEIGLPMEQLKSYAAVYESATEGQRTVSYEDGRLLYFVKGGSKARLIPFETDRFYFENSLDIIEFLRKKNGRITGMTLETAGKINTFIRTGIKPDNLYAINISTQLLEKYVGKYQFPDNFILIITRDGNRLYGKGTGPRQIRQEIVPYDTCSFFARNLDARLMFHLDEKHTVTGLTKIQNGESVAKKIE
ncbi:serine hydrolase [Chitinophaga polysaccharea]|uniref:serine hydrolase n=1 Tax=Chitinophaga polysaccharea TaxID=1293035 RepID=UPI00115C3FDA|nr:serine hydrolase [Chitinophaga polysaccharea]